MNSTDRIWGFLYNVHYSWQNTFLDSINRKLLHFTQNGLYLSIQLTIGIVVPDVVGKVPRGCCLVAATPTAVLLDLPLNPAELCVSFLCKPQLTSNHGLE